MRIAHQLSVLLPATMIAAPLTAQDIPDRPEQLAFAPLHFESPRAADYRYELADGTTVFLAPSREVPLVNLVFTFKGGVYLDPAAIVGLTDATGALMRRGGTTTLAAEELDERLDFLAADVSVSVGSTSSSASLNCLTDQLDASLALFMDMIRNPGFQGNRVEVYVDEQLEAMRQRNDFPDAILSREWDALLYGEDHHEARLATRSMLQAMTVNDLQAMHQRIFQPGNLIIAVNGDFDPDDMLKRLERVMQGWTRTPPAADPPSPKASFTPGMYHVEKDIPQGKVFIGLRTIPRDHPDYFPMLLMNDILGGGGFTSRITKRVRNDEGLAYSAGSSLQTRVHYPGEWRASFQSKSRTVALSIKIILEEIERLRSEPVSEETLATAKNAFIETFPRTFESKAGMLAVFVSDELTNRADDYWMHYRDNIQNVSIEEIGRVAKTWLDPSQLAIFIVGNWEQIEQGDLDGRASMQEFFGGRVTHRPLRNPFTLDPLK
jgi:zinc protease